MRKILLSLLFLFPLCLSAQEDDVTFSPTPDVTLPGSTYAETTEGEAIPDNNQNAWKTGDRHFPEHILEDKIISKPISDYLIPCLLANFLFLIHFRIQLLWY